MRLFSGYVSVFTTLIVYSFPVCSSIRDFRVIKVLLLQIARLDCQTFSKFSDSKKQFGQFFACCISKYFLSCSVFSKKYRKKMTTGVVFYSSNCQDLQVLSRVSRDFWKWIWHAVFSQNFFILSYSLYELLKIMLSALKKNMYSKTSFYAIIVS